MNEQDTKFPLNKGPQFLSWTQKILGATEAKIAFKTGLAASISLVVGLSIAEAFDRPDTLVSGLWCVMAAIVVIQANLGGTYKAAWIRFLGVLVGSAAGAVFIDLIGTGFLSLGVSVFLTIVLCALLNIKDSFRIAALSTAVIIILGGLHPTINPWLFSFYRFLDSCTGILIALIIARLIWPKKAIENVRQNISKTLNLLSKYFLLSVELEPENQGQIAVSEALFTEIIGLLKENRDYRKEAEIELFDNLSLREQWMLITDQLENVFKSVETLRNVQKETILQNFSGDLANQLADAIKKVSDSFQALDKMIKKEIPAADLTELNLSLQTLNEALLRFRETRTTRKFSIENVESFFVFFYSLRSIMEALMKMNLEIKELSKIE